MQQDPLGDGQVSSVYERQDGAKGASSMTALAHQFPPPLSSGCLLWPNGWDTGTQDWLSQSLFLDWGTVLQAPSNLYMYVHESD